MINEISKNDVIDIINGYAVINNKKILFSERSIIDDTLYMIIPLDFKQMQSEIAISMFSDESRPDIIFTDELESMNISFSFREERFEMEETEEFNNALQQSIQETNPSYRFISNDVIDLGDIRIGYFEFVSPIDEDELYNIMFIFSFNGRLVLGSFNRYYADTNKWFEVSMQMLHSIRIVRNNKN